MNAEIEQTERSDRRHPIDDDIVRNIAQNGNISPTVLDAVLCRCSQRWDKDREMVPWAVEQFQATAFDVKIEYVNEEMMIIDGQFFSVIDLMQRAGIRSDAITANVSLLQLAIMAQKAHTEQAIRLREREGYLDKDPVYPVVMYMPGYTARD